MAWRWHGNGMAMAWQRPSSSASSHGSRIMGVKSCTPAAGPPAERAPRLTGARGPGPAAWGRHAAVADGPRICSWAFRRRHTSRAVSLRHPTGAPTAPTNRCPHLRDSPAGDGRHLWTYSARPSSEAGGHRGSHATDCHAVLFEELARCCRELRARCAAGHRRGRLMRAVHRLLAERA